MNRDFQQDIKNLNYYGYTILNNYFSIEKCNFYLNLINKYCNDDYKKELLKNEIPGWEGGWIHNLQNKDYEFIKLMDDEYIEKILKYKLNDKYFRNQEKEDPNYILQIFSARASGKNYLDLHTDVRGKGMYDSTLGITILWYLTDTNIENGCTFIVPGSHNIFLKEADNSYVTDRDFKNKIPIEAKAGDVIIFDQGLWHGSYENKTNELPWRLMAGFNRWWIKQSFDIPKTITNDIYQKLNDKQKSILGFCSEPPISEFDRLSMTIKYTNLKKSI